LGCSFAPAAAAAAAGAHQVVAEQHPPEARQKREQRDAGGRAARRRRRGGERGSRRRGIPPAGRAREGTTAAATGLGRRLLLRLLRLAADVGRHGGNSVPASLVAGGKRARRRLCSTVSCKKLAESRERFCSSAAFGDRRERDGSSIAYIPKTIDSIVD
jgi:hypothetical protein